MFVPAWSLAASRHLARGVRALPTATTRSLATLGSLLDARRTDMPMKESFTATQQKLQWDNTELGTHVDAVARGLVELGYKNGTKLAVWMTNEAEHLCLYFAAAKAGVVLVTLDPALSAAAVGKVLKDEGCRGLVFSERFGGRLREGDVQSLVPELGAGSWGDLVSSKAFRSLRHVISSGWEVADGVTKFAEFPVYGSTDDILPEVAGYLSDDDVLVVPYAAGGDVDTPVRGTPMNHDDLVDAASKTASDLGLTAKDTLVVTSPLSSTGITDALAATIVGAKVVLPSKEFNADIAAKSVAKAKATAFVGEAAHVAAVEAAASLKTASR